MAYARIVQDHIKFPAQLPAAAGDDYSIQADYRLTIPSGVSIRPSAQIAVGNTPDKLRI